MSIKKRDTRVYLPKQQKPFPDPAIPMPKYRNIKVYRANPKVKSVKDAAGTRMFLAPRQVKPKIMKLVPSFGKKKDAKSLRKSSRVI